MRQFPNDFLWGASTSSHQVEGNTNNQWSEWEKKNAHRLAKTAEKRLHWLPNWADIAPQATDPANYISGTGIDHYTHFREDFDLLTKLNMNAFRFSIEWSRIEPVEGVWDKAAIQHYKTYFAELKKRNITPIVTLWHWTLPVWFAQKGGFEKRANIIHFESYVQKVCEFLGDDVRYVITLNEPNVYTGFSYGTGEWPPQVQKPLMAMTVYNNLAIAHKRAYQIIKAIYPDMQVGIAAQLADARPLNPKNILNKLSVSASMYGWNWWFLNRIQHHQDFIGINYYFTEYRDWRGRVKNPSQPVSDVGWYMQPDGIQNLLQTVRKRYHLPLLIVENGLADASDAHRKWWLEQTIAALQATLANDVNLIGYLHWSLLDNFEWAYGWWPKFGLISVDRKTMQRTVRASAKTYAQIIADAKRPARRS